MYKKIRLYSDPKLYNIWVNKLSLNLKKAFRKNKRKNISRFRTRDQADIHENRARWFDYNKHWNVRIQRGTGGPEPPENNHKI